jgi:aspartyl-tRNA(Asn)/glutamyl-tRNA(Gln) amidotransferase subunit A
MTRLRDTLWLSAVELVRLYARAKLSPVEVMKGSLAEIERQEGRINALVEVHAEEAMAAARASEKRWRRGEPLGPVDGVPVLVKDLLLVRGWKTLRGSKTVEPNQAWDQDAPCVARLRECGAVLLASTTTPEFGWKGVTDSPLTGITRNPWDLSRTPGGSSGGSSAALAAGYAPLALGTDGGGSIRIPAGFTGVFGHKPSFGRVPAWPLSPFGTVAHVGPMTRTVADAALMLNVISQPDPRDWHALPYDGRDYARKLGKGLKGLRIAFSPALRYAEVDPEVASCVAAAVKVLKELGANVEVAEPGFEDPTATFRTLWWAGVRNLLAKLPDKKRALLDPALAAVLEQSMSLTLEDFLEANRARAALGSHMRRFMERYDLLATPSLPIVAFAAGQLAPESAGTPGTWVNWTPFSYPFNLTQQPAASVPCGFTPSGLPVGLQLVGRMFDDHTVLRAAHAYQRATIWTDRRPAGLA